MKLLFIDTIYPQSNNSFIGIKATVTQNFDIPVLQVRAAMNGKIDTGDYNDDIDDNDDDDDVDGDDDNDDN